MLDLSQKSKIESFRHFCDEWQQIRDTLLSCEQSLHVMSDELNNRSVNVSGVKNLENEQDQLNLLDGQHANRNEHDHFNRDCSDNNELQFNREKLRQILKSIEPKKYEKNSRIRSKRRSINRLKHLTQLLMTTNLKRSTSLQSVAVAKPNDVTDDTTATLPRLRRRPRFTRFYHSLDVSDNDNNDCDQKDTNLEGDQKNKLSLSLLTSASSHSDSTVGQTQRQQQDLSSNRFSCDVSSLLSLSSPTSQSSVPPTPPQSLTNSKQILKYSKKRLRGPYGEMLESMMNTKNVSENDCNADSVKQSLSFIQELLKETEKQRKELDAKAIETTGTSTATPTEEIQTSSDVSTTVTPIAQSITATIGRHLDTRTHIVGELYDTEKTFCEQLRDLCEKYSKPLNEFLIIDSIFVEIIFGKIPDILSIHSKFLEDLRHRITSWSPSETTIGDLFESFGEKNCFETYLSFVDNWYESKQLIKQLAREKPLFQKFLEQKSREHKLKLSLDELMISIIQRIPRFELLLKQLLKNTSKEHKDFELLNNALEKIHSLVLYINRVQNDADVNYGQREQLDVNSMTLKDLEFICDSLPTQSLLNSTLISISFVTIRKRERLLMLFNDWLIICSIKGKKKSEKFEENKYKVLNCFSLDFLELISKNENNLNQENNELFIEKDLQILQSIQSSSLLELSQNSRQSLELFINEMIINLNKQLTEFKNCGKNLELISTQIESQSREPLLISFSSQEKRQKFEHFFNELKAKQKKTQKIVPEFVCALPIRKTRAGLQFTCASPTIGTNDVWICNSDGFVGQISVLSINNQTSNNVEPTVVSCNGVCNSRIICMTCVPKCEQSVQQTSEESDVSDSDCGDSNPMDSIGNSSLTTGRRERKKCSLSSTMWFGTDDSSVHIYSCSDAIRYFCERVFVGLANQSVAVFDRDPFGNWNTIPIIRENINCFRFCATNNATYLWTTHSNVIAIRDANLEPQDDDLIVDLSPDDFIQNVQTIDSLNFVFISSNNSLSIHLFSSQKPYNHLSSISIASSLNKALISCEDIIRQHKSACLKISSLLAVHDKLWIGTSAGIICILDSNRLQNIEIVPNGHTGHVRFLTSIESSGGKTLVISGGDGLEIFATGDAVVSSGQSVVSTGGQNQSNQNSDNGRDDSTNHLLLWQI